MPVVAGGAPRGDDMAVFASPAELLLVFVLPGIALGVAVHFLGDSLSEHVAAGRGAPVIAGLSAIALVPLLFWFTTGVGHRLAAIVFALLTGGLLALGVAWSVQRYGVDSSVGVPIGRTMAFALPAAFVLAPFFGAVRSQGSEPPYAGLFRRAWNQTVIGLVAAAFCGAVLLLNLLVVELFELIAIDLDGWLYDERWLAGLAGGAFAAAIGLAREQEGIVHALRGLLLALVRTLLPVHLLVVVVFLGATVLRGPTALDTGLSVTALLLLVTALAATFAAAALGDGVGPVVPRWRRVAMRALAALVLPLSLLAGWTLWLRIDDYGLTAERIVAAVLVLLAAGYGAGYVLAAFRSDLEAVLARTNTAMALLGALVATLMLTPPGDPVRLAVSDQLARATRDGADPARIDLAWLAFETGRPGRAALERIRALPAAAEPPLAARLAMLDDSGDAYAFRDREGTLEPDGADTRIERERLSAALESGAVRVLVRERGGTRRVDTLAAPGATEGTAPDATADPAAPIASPSSLAGITALLLTGDRLSSFAEGCGRWQESCTVVISDEPTLVPGAFTALMASRYDESDPVGLAHLSWYAARRNEAWTLLDDRMPMRPTVDGERLQDWFTALRDGELPLESVNVMGLRIGDAVLVPDGQPVPDTGFSNAGSPDTGR